MPPDRTWPIFSFALMALLGLMLVPALTALRRSEAIYGAIRASQEQFQQAQRVFDDLSQNIFTVSITVREFLLDTSPGAARMYRSRLDGVRGQLETNVERLRQALPPDGGAALSELQQQIDGYLGAVLSVFDWTAEQRAQRGLYFLREEQRPRRETILAVAEKLAELNAAAYADQQRRTTESERWFRSQLRESVGFALLTGIIISAAGILRMRSLERRARQQRLRAEDATDEMRGLSVRLRHAQEEERRTIARELHDEVGQTLTALRMELGALQRMRTGDEREFDACLAEVKGLAERSVQTIRNIAAGLRPAVLDDLGLGAAIHKQVREFSQRTGLPASTSIDGAFDRLTDRQRTYIYRVVQEALTNCAKHARARTVSVRLLERDGAIALTIADDGIGFDRQTIGDGGLGLIGIEERVRELGGSVTVRSSTGSGTVIQASIPVQEARGSDSRSHR